jgi:hypothetical protein
MEGEASVTPVASHCYLSAGSQELVPPSSVVAGHLSDRLFMSS